MIKKITNKAGTLPWALALSATLVGCGSDDNKASDAAPDTQQTTNSVLIEYTSFGVPHISADNAKSLYYGQAYAHAKDNMCTLAEEVIGVRAQRALTFGAGSNDANIAADLAVQVLDVYGQAQAAMDTISSDHLEVLSGYANGFNQAVLDKNGAYPSPCSGDNAYAIPTVEVVDLYAYHLYLALYASGAALSGSIATASVPVTQVANSTTVNTSLVSSINAVTEDTHQLGSNGWALGKDKTESGKGMLLSNPHFPWSGSKRFVQSQLTIPGELNITGVSFVGVPGILIGFNEHLAWTHTVSQSKRFTLYNLTLDPEDATRYLYGEEYRQMSSQDYTVTVLNEDGTTSEVSKTLYASHYGPMIGWSNGGAQTYRDANQGNHNMVKQWLAMNKATSLAEFEQAFADFQGIPWVNTIATDKEGTAFYIDGSRTANLHPLVDAGVKSALINPATDVATATLQYLWQGGRGQLILDGSNPFYEWIDTGTTPVAGVVPFENAPKLTRTDYVFNANSSPWLTNMTQTMDDFSIVYGPANTVRSPRTRLNATMLEEVSANGSSGADGKYSLTELKAVVTGERGMSSELIKNELAQRCNGVTTVTVDQTVVDISAACTVLSNWDGLYKNTSVGSQVFREFLKEFHLVGEAWLSDDLFEVSFDATAPLATPSGLKANSAEVAANEDPILLALGAAVQTLQLANIALDAPLGDLQYAMKNDERISIPGGIGLEGVFDINSSGSSKVGANDYEVTHGASWVMALEFTDAGPKADAFLAYSQSHDPESEFYADQTRLFSTGDWRPVVFTAEEIANDLVSSSTLQTH
ncbi:MAG: penicillin acylase family protein [Bermanella sp.]